MFLQVNHCDYKNLKTDKDNLLTLSEDDSISDQLSACEVNELFFPNLNNILNS